MTAAERIMLASRLQLAINKMAGRYGITCMDLAYAKPGAEYAAVDRVACRQYQALMRLTSALSDLASGGTR